MTGPLLRASDLTLEASDGTTLLDSVDLELGAGESLGIVGEAGAGKSLLARALLGLPPLGVRIVRGEVVLEGRDLLKLPAAELQQLRGERIALIFPDAKRHLNPLERVGNQIADVIQAHRKLKRKAALAEAAELLRGVGVADAEARSRGFVHELSGGLAQRVLIAMAMAHHPGVLVADEPTASLDVTIQKQVLDLLLARVKESGAGQIIVTRDLGIVAQYCERVAIMRAGRVVEVASVQTLFTIGPSDPYSAELLDAVLEDRGTSATRPAEPRDALEARP
jgi:peptide/nickel transport system ATP-binding protein